MTEPVVGREGGGALERRAGAAGASMLSMPCREGGAVLSSAVETLKLYGFKTDHEISLGNAREIVKQIGAFVRKQIHDVWRETPPFSTREEAQKFGAQLLVPFDLVDALERVVEAREVMEQGQESRYRELFQDSGGIFIGSEELGINGELPVIPYTIEFLQSDHPLRAGKRIVDCCALVFDPETDRWHLFELDIIPGSLGPNGKGLSGDRQDELVERIEVAGVTLTAPQDSCLFARAHERVVRIQRDAGVPENDLFLRHYWARTADTQRAIPGVYARVLICLSLSSGTSVNCTYSADRASDNVGLAGVWDLPADRRCLEAIS